MIGNVGVRALENLLLDRGIVEREVRKEIPEMGEVGHRRAVNRDGSRCPAGDRE